MAELTFKPVDEPLTFKPVEKPKADAAVTFTPAEPKEHSGFIEDLRKEITGGAGDIAKGFTEQPTGIMKSRLGPMLGGAARIASAPFTAVGHWIEGLPAPGTGKTIGEGVAAANAPGARPEWSPRLETPGEVLETAVFGGGAKGGLKAGMKLEAERLAVEAATPPPIKFNPESIEVRQSMPGTGELTPGFIRAQENALYQITQGSEADKIEFLKKTTKLPEEAKSPVMQEKLFHRIENEPTGMKPVASGFARFYHGGIPYKGGKRWLTPDEKYAEGYARGSVVQYVDIPESSPLLRKSFDDTGTSQKAPYVSFEAPENIAKGLRPVSGSTVDPAVEKLFQETIMPLQRERAQLYKDITGSGYDIEDLSKGARRIAKGTAPHFDELGAAQDPIAGGRSLPRTTSSLQERKYYALEGSDGSRLVIKKLENGGAEIWQDKRVIGEVPGDIEVGETARVLDTPFTVKQATTKELESHTPTEYHKNAWANTVDDIVRLRKVKRAIEYLDTLKASPEWLNHATMSNMRKPPGWKQTQLPQLAGWFMEPKLAHVFDDFYGARTPLSETLEKVNRFATRSLFWGPIPHIENVMAHWYVGRGFDWITPQGVRSLFQDGARAMHQVYSQGKDFQRLLREGSALQSPRVTNQHFYEQLTKKIGGEIERDPQRWGPIAKTLGFNKLADFVAWYYNGVSKVLWQANDVFMLQRQFELERKGISTAHAIEDAEKHIPNYRIPTEVMKTRALSELLQNPNVFVFSRYHYGIFKSYANMLGDLAKGTPAQKRDSIGNLFALGTLVWGIYPLLTAGLQKLTENKDSKKLSRGAASFPQALMDLYGGDKGLPEVIGSVMTLAPGTKTAGELMTNLDWFTGRHIYEPADLRHKRYGRVAAQLIEYAAQNAISPYKLVDDYIKDKDAKSLVRAAIDQQAGLKEPTDRQMMGKRKAFKYQEREERQRQKKPRGLIESLEKKAEDTFQGPMQ